MSAGYLPTALNRYKYGSGGPIPFFDAHWKDFQNGGLIKDLIIKCLKLEPGERISAVKALEHPWFKA